MNPFGSESGGAEAYAPPFGLSHKFDTQRKNEVKKALQKTRQVPANVPVDECNPSGDGSISFDEVNQQSHYQSYSPTSTSAAVFRATAAFKSLPSQDAWIMDDICNRKLSRLLDADVLRVRRDSMDAVKDPSGVGSHVPWEGIEVSLASTREMGGRTYYILACSTEQLPAWHVARTYSHFAEAHKALTYEGCSMAKMPVKHHFKSSSNFSVVEERVLAFPPVLASIMSAARQGVCPAAVQEFLALGEASEHWRKYCQISLKRKEQELQMAQAEARSEEAKARAAGMVQEAEQEVARRMRELEEKVAEVRRIAGAMSVQYESEVQRHQEELQAAAKQLVAMAGPVFGQDGLC